MREKDIRHALQLYGIPYEGVEYIPIGVMTDKFAFGSEGSKYIARCYPEERDYLAEAEYRYMQKFRERGVLCPKPVRIIDVGPYLCFIYEMLEGRMLSEVYDQLSEKQKDDVCREIVDNYMRISEVRSNGHGWMLGYEKFSHGSIEDLVDGVVNNAEEWIMQYGQTNSQAKKVLEKFKQKALFVEGSQPMLVWSEMSMDNIIVDERVRLVGFVDFEGLMGADLNLGVGYLQAHENDSNFVMRLMKMMPELEEEKVKFYAMMRYLRILPNTHLPLPNGTKRENLNEYLPYVRKNL